MKHSKKTYLRLAKNLKCSSDHMAHILLRTQLDGRNKASRMPNARQAQPSRRNDDDMKPKFSSHLDFSLDENCQLYPS